MKEADAGEKEEPSALDSALTRALPRQPARKRKFFFSASAAMREGGGSVMRSGDEDAAAAGLPQKGRMRIERPERKPPPSSKK